MGSDRLTEDTLLTRIAQVVPDIPSFAVDDGFAYRVPDHIANVTLGSIVRVPVGGRRLRGWVVAMRTGAADRPLRDILSVSGSRPIFGERQLNVLRWAAMHYVAPTSVVLPKSGPPNLPTRGRQVKLDPLTDGGETHPRLVLDLLAGRRPPSIFRTGHGDWVDLIAGDVRPLLAEDRNVLVVVPSNREVAALGGELTRRLGERRVLVVGDTDARTTTAAWVAAAATPGRAVIGTREIAYWGLPDLSLAVVVEPGRRVMKSPQTPTIDTARLLGRRSAFERMGLLMLGQVPTADAVAAGVVVEEGPGRSWPLVEVVDRGEEPPGAGVVMERVKRALGIALQRKQTAFVLVNRRGYAPAVRCVACRTLRICPSCGVAPGRGAVCDRCGAPNGPCTGCGASRFEALGAGVGRVVDELGRSLGTVVAAAPASVPIQVGTERDLVDLGGVDVAVAVDADGLLLAPNYRAEEEALRILARTAARVQGGPGSRFVIQTAQPHHRVVTALRGGRGTATVREIVDGRHESGFPPARELLAIEIAGDPGTVSRNLATLPGDVDVLGPAASGDRWRWLVQADDLRPTRVLLRNLVQQWRDEGSRVRIDVDPIDL